MATRRRTKTEPAQSAGSGDPTGTPLHTEGAANGGGGASDSNEEEIQQDPSNSVSINCPDPDQIVPSQHKSQMGRLGSAAAPAPFHTEEVAIKERESIDYSIRISAEMAREGKAPRRVRVYADGIYDLFHQGHARQLMQAKNVFPKADVYLLVGVCSDALTRAKKGKTVMDENERYEALRHCRYVDEVVIDAPWSTDEEFVEKHKIDFVAHDDVPYTIGSGKDIYAWLKDKGMFVATQRTDGVSTSDVVARILKDYDTFIRRNLARGYTTQEMNVSFFRGKKLQLANKVDEIKETVKRKEEEYKSTAKDLIGSFLNLFGQREFSIDRFWANSRQRITQALSPPTSPAGSGEDDGSEEDDEPAAKRRKSSSGDALKSTTTHASLSRQRSKSEAIHLSPGTRKGIKRSKK